MGEVLGALACEGIEWVGVWMVAEGFAVDGREGSGRAVFQDEVDAGEPGVGFKLQQKPSASR